MGQQDGKHRIDFKEALAIAAAAAKVGMDAARLADGVTPDELDDLLRDIDALRDQVRTAKAD